MLEIGPDTNSLTAGFGLSVKFLLIRRLSLWTPCFRNERTGRHANQQHRQKNSGRQPCYAAEQAAEPKRFQQLTDGWDMRDDANSFVHRCYIRQLRVASQQSLQLDPNVLPALRHSQAAHD